MHYRAAALSGRLHSKVVVLIMRPRPNPSPTAHRPLQVITVVNRDAVERVAPPPTLRGVEFGPSPWRVPDMTNAAAAMDDGHPAAVADFMARLSRARKRLQCASDYFE